MACLSNSKLNYKRINIFERSIELCIANSSKAQIGTELPSIMKMTSSKIKNTFNEFGEAPSIWENKFETYSNNSQAATSTSHSNELILTKH